MLHIWKTFRLPCPTSYYRKRNHFYSNLYRGSPRVCLIAFSDMTSTSLWNSQTSFCRKAAIVLCLKPKSALLDVILIGLVLPTGETQNTMWLVCEYFFLMYIQLVIPFQAAYVHLPQFFTRLVFQTLHDSGCLLVDRLDLPIMWITSYPVSLEALVLSFNMN